MIAEINDFNKVILSPVPPGDVGITKNAVITYMLARVSQRADLCQKATNAVMK